MDPIKLRAWYAHRQGLDGRLRGVAPADILADAGWARSMGGSGPYLTLHARGRVVREAADRGMTNLELHELPAARGCTYVIPAADFALALTLSSVGHEAEMKVAAKLGVTEKEIEKLCEAVLKALAKGPLDPAEIREVVGPAARNLGEEGRKKGITTTVPLATGRLQSTGEIRRVPVNGRLDHQRYKYTLWKPSAMGKTRMDREQALHELAHRYFYWAGPATIANFQTFAGINGKEAKAATADLKLDPIEAGSDLLLLPGDRAAFEAFKVPKQPQFELIPTLDGLPLLRVDLKPLVDPDDLKHKLFREEIYATMPKKMEYLPSNAIVDRGRIVGLWEYDPELTKAVAETEEFIRRELEDVRAASLDSVKTRAPRFAALRKCN